MTISDFNKGSELRLNRSNNLKLESLDVSSVIISCRVDASHRG